MTTTKKSPTGNNDNPLQDAVYAQIASLDTVVVAHEGLSQALAGLTECIAWSAHSKEPAGAVLLGVGGTGKTTLCNAIVNRFPPVDVVEDDALIKKIPAFYAYVPSPSGIRSLALKLLEHLGETSMNRSRTTDLTKRLSRLLTRCGTKIILLDEFHHLLAEGGPDDKRSVKICNWLKTLIDQTNVMVCLVGVPACEALVQSDSQMSRRFKRRFKLSELSCGTKAAPGPLGKFLRSIGKEFKAKLELDNFIDFKDHAMVVRIWAATSGNLSFVMDLLKQASAIALLSDRKTVVAGDLEEAYSKGITSTVTKVSANPFKMTDGELFRALDNKTRVKGEK